jgi:uncharacterized protein YoxC
MRAAVWIAAVAAPLAVLAILLARTLLRIDTGSDEVLETLRRIEADVTELKTRLPVT